MLTKSRTDILSRAVDECFQEMYKYAQPPLDFADAIRRRQNGETGDDIADSKEDPLYKRHYLSHENCVAIVDHFKYLYHIGNDFKDNIELVKDYFNNGSETVYNEEYGRHYIPITPIKEKIGDEAYNTLEEYFEKCSNFYSRDAEESGFNIATFLGPSPNSNKESVIEYWKNKGVDVKIEDFNIWDKIYNDDEID